MTTIMRFTDIRDSINHMCVQEFADFLQDYANDPCWGCAFRRDNKKCAYTEREDCIEGRSHWLFEQVAGPDE